MCDSMIPLAQSLWKIHSSAEGLVENTGVNFVVGVVVAGVTVGRSGRCRSTRRSSRCWFRHSSVGVPDQALCF